MKIKYCGYCGGPIGGCDCDRLAAEWLDNFLNDYENDPLVQAGWAQQDLIDLRRRER